MESNFTVEKCSRMEIESKPDYNIIQLLRSIFHNESYAWKSLQAIGPNLPNCRSRYQVNIRNNLKSRGPSVIRKASSGDFRIFFFCYCFILILKRIHFLVLFLNRGIAVGLLIRLKTKWKSLRNLMAYNSTLLYMTNKQTNMEKGLSEEILREEFLRDWKKSPHVILKLILDKKVLSVLPSGSFNNIDILTTSRLSWYQSLNEFPWLGDYECTWSLLFLDISFNNITEEQIF